MGWAGTQMSLICYNEAHVLMDWRAGCKINLFGRSSWKASEEEPGW